MSWETPFVDWKSYSALLAALYLAMAVVSGFQLLRILYYKHRTFSYHFGFLTCCFCWGIVRAVFFLFITEWERMPYLVLYWWPIGIQFTTFSLLAVFYTQQVYRETWKESTRKFVATIYLFFNALFFGFLVVYWILCYAVGTKTGDVEEDDGNPEWLDICAQAFSGVVFFVLVVILGVYGVRVFNLVRHKQIPVPFNVKGASNTLVLVATALIVTIFTLRSVYDFVSMFGVLAIAVQAGTSQNELKMFFFYLILEITPAFVVLLLFIRIPQTKKRGIVPRKAALGSGSSANVNKRSNDVDEVTDTVTNSFREEDALLPNKTILSSTDSFEYYAPYDTGTLSTSYHSEYVE